MSTPAPPANRDLPRIIFGTLLILLLGVGSLWILKPFLLALIWATMIVAATWPMLAVVERRLGGRRMLAQLGSFTKRRHLVAKPRLALLHRPPRQR
jgi:predicted PurR-regulated permease PerM